MNKLMNFHHSGDVLSSLGLGLKPMIENWLESVGVKRYEINKDFSINIFGDLNLTNKKIKNFPNFIKFDIIYGGFYGEGNEWNSLDGMPNEVQGDFELRGSWLAINENERKFSEEEIRNKIKIKGKLWF